MQSQNILKWKFMGNLSYLISISTKIMTVTNFSYFLPTFRPIMIFFQSFLVFNVVDRRDFKLAGHKIRNWSTFSKQIFEKRPTFLINHSEAFFKRTCKEIWFLVELQMNSIIAMFKRLVLVFRDTSYNHAQNIWDEN